MENTIGVQRNSALVLAQTLEALEVPDCKYTSYFLELASIPSADMGEHQQLNSPNSGYSHSQNPGG